MYVSSVLVLGSKPPQVPGFPVLKGSVPRRNYLPETQVCTVTQMQVSDDVTTITTRLRNREELMGGAQPLTLCKFVEARVSSHALWRRGRRGHLCSMSANAIERPHWRHKATWLSASAWQKTMESSDSWTETTRALACTPGCAAARSNQHGDCATATAHTVHVVLHKLRDVCISKITAEIFLPCSLMNSYNRGRFSCFTAGDVKHSCSICTQKPLITWD